MAMSYLTRELIQGATSPGWSVNQPAFDGCQSYLTSISARTDTMPAASQQFYEPYSETVVRDTRHIRGRTRGNPPFRMTPRFVSRTRRWNYLTKRMQGLNGFRDYKQSQHTAKVAGNCTRILDSTWGDEIQHLTYYDIADNNYLNPGSTYVKHGWSQDKINDAIASVENDVSTSALTSYDLLTDIAEAREIPGLVRSICLDIYSIAKILTRRFTITDLRNAAYTPVGQLLKSSTKAFRKIGDTWMQYRYGIMPLAYSYRDINKTIDRGMSNTSRSFKIVKPDDLNPVLPPSTQNYRWSEIEGDVRINGTVFQWFHWIGGAQRAGLGMNPLVTAWELIPYSFVIDWFVDVGSYITRTTSGSMADKCWACISQRSNYVKRTWYHFAANDLTVTIANRQCTNWLGSNAPSTPSLTIARPEESQLLSEESTEEYHRWLFSLNDAHLRYKPSLNWRRLVDAAVMSVNQLGALNRHLKGA